MRFQRIGIRIRLSWTVEGCHRSPLAGEDMPRKPLDSLEAANAPGIAGGCRPKVVKHPPGCPAASDALIAALLTTGENVGAHQAVGRRRPGRAPRRGPPEGPSETPSGEEAPGGVRRKARRRRLRRGGSRQGLTGFSPPPRPFGVGVVGTKNRSEYGISLTPKTRLRCGMSFAILRIAKEHNRAGVAARAAHNLRQHSAAPRADAERSAKNKTIGAQTVPDVLAALDARLGMLPAAPEERGPGRRADARRLRPNGVPPAANPGDSRMSPFEWAYAKFGKENILTASLHRDEKTPHLQILLTPIVEKKGVAKLRASHYFDGPSKMRDLQTEFAAHVEKLGLRRGIERKPSEPIKRHTTLKEYYKLVEQIVERAKKAYEAPAVPALPALPARGMLGRVSDDDWSALADSLAKHGAEVARLRAEAIAGRLFMDSSVGTEVGRAACGWPGRLRRRPRKRRGGPRRGRRAPSDRSRPWKRPWRAYRPTRGPEGADGKARRRDRAAGRAARHWPPGSAPGPARRGDRKAATSTRRVRRLSLAWLGMLTKSASTPIQINDLAHFGRWPAQAGASLGGACGLSCPGWWEDSNLKTRKPRA